MQRHPFAAVTVAHVLFLLLAGCATSPEGGRQLSETGKVALQEVATIAVRRATSNSPRAAEKAQNIRELAVKLQAFTAVATVQDLKAAVQGEVDKLELSPVDRADAQSLLNIFAALLTDYLGSDKIDADALVKVNEFASMIVSALPALPPA